MSRGEPTQVFTMASLLPDAATVESGVADVVKEDSIVDEVPEFSIVDDVLLDVIVDEHEVITDANTRTVKCRGREILFIDAFGVRAICS